MPAHYHPDPETLAEYALGALAPGMELVVSGHLTFCPDCRSRVETYEALGGAALDTQSLADVNPPSLDATLALLGEEPPATPSPIPVQSSPSVFHSALQSFIPSNQDEIPWKFRLPGIYEHELTGFEHESVSLLKAKPGAKMLSHTHEGEEATLILSGQMLDGSRTYTKGDVSQADHDHDHRPEIIGDETCICLIVLSGKMRFTGTIGRALNVLMR